MKPFVFSQSRLCLNYEATKGVQFIVHSVLGSLSPPIKMPTVKKLGLCVCVYVDPHFGN